MHEVFRQNVLHRLTQKHSLFSFWSALVYPYTLIVISWAALVLLDTTHQLQWLDHDYLLTTIHLPWLLVAGVFLAGWQVMMIAMMLPALLPLVAQIDSSRPDIVSRWKLQATFLGSYALVWTLFAISVFIGDSAIHWLVSHWFWLSSHVWLIGTSILLLAGLFQWSPYKKTALSSCSATDLTFLRSSRTLLCTAWRLGIRYGRACFGSCWVLMLAMIAMGMKSLFIMTVGSVIILAEKNSSAHLSIRVAVGILCLGLAVVWGISAGHIR